MTHDSTPSDDAGSLDVSGPSGEPDAADRTVAPSGENPDRALRPGDERARFVAACYVAAFRAVSVLAASAAALTTLVLLAVVQRLVATPTVQFAGATVPLTQFVAGVVLAVLVKRLYDLNVADRTDDG